MRSSHRAQFLNPYYASQEHPLPQRMLLIEFFTVSCLVFMMFEIAV